jgi:SAM-dependent methyltransferase
MMESLKQSVSEYYGKTVQKTDDLAYDACCTTDYDPRLTAKLTDEVLERRYGCGSPIPEVLTGKTVLDLGCGAGADCFIAAQLVGESGRVIGVDMTDEQLAVAERNIAPHMDAFGFSKPNIEFRKGFIEDIPVDTASVDVVISNCVINLSDDKKKVFEEIARVLAPGGEFYIADIVADRRVPAHLQGDELLWNECLTGAAYVEDLRRLMSAAGFADVRVVKSRRLSDVIEGIRFDSRTLRGFKLPLEDRREDFGQVAVYRGTIESAPTTFVFDDVHTFEAGRAVRICKNTADMLIGSRFSAHFDVSPPLRHLGLFDDASAAPQDDESAPATQSAPVREPVVEIAVDKESSGSCC